MKCAATIRELCLGHMLLSCEIQGLQPLFCVPVPFACSLCDVGISWQSPKAYSQNKWPIVYVLLWTSIWYSCLVLSAVRVKLQVAQTGISDWKMDMIQFKFTNEWTCNPEFIISSVLFVNLCYMQCLDLKRQQWVSGSRKWQVMPHVCLEPLKCSID